MKDKQVERNIDSWRKMIKATQECDYEGFTRQSTDTYFCHGPGKGIDTEATDKEKTREEKLKEKNAIETGLNAFSNPKFTNEMFGVGDRVTNYWVFEGVHDRGEYKGVKPTGNRVKFSGIAIGRFENGKLAEEWEYWDELTMYKQLGVLPENASSLSPASWKGQL